MHSISIIIPVYNRAHIVERTLDSVLKQSYRPLQVVLVDNDSSDDTLDVLERWNREHAGPDLDVMVVVESQHTAGAARNRGAQCASGDWLVFFDSDDEMHPDLIRDYAEAIEQDGGEVDVVSTGATLRYADGATRQLPFHTDDIMAVQMLHSQLATQRYMVRAEFFHAVGEWNASLPVWNDWELGVRMLLNRPRMAYMANDRVVVNHSGEASITGNGFAAKAGQWENVMDVVEDELAQSTYSDKQRMLRLLNFKRMVLAAHYEREGKRELSVELCRTAYHNLHKLCGNTLKWKLWTSPMIKKLFARIVHGKRGSAVIARKFL
ncbi:MAG: glycosyltransferase family 2 protein [Muribaculaceae bacterium]|nr:glycosyltransferase family 2 protein [Muribaculaceae bacterium]